MKIVRSIGESFSQKAEAQTDGPKSRSLFRGIRPKGNDAPVPASEIATFLGGNPKLTVRQTVAILDKVIHKTRTLRTFQFDAYVDRVMLAEELWKRLEMRFNSASISLDDVGEARVRWMAKAHPYARHEVSLRDPQKDKNAKDIVDANNGRSRDEFRHRWHGVFWRLDANLRPDYGAIADAILNHLHDQEHLLASTAGNRLPRKKNAVESGKGLIAARIHSIAMGTNDPREGRKAGQEASNKGWDAASEAIYFDLDIARMIHESCLATPRPNSPITAATIGQKLFEHFGTLKGRTAENSPGRKSLWWLHKAVCDFYRKLSKTERFRRAVEEASKAEPVSADTAKRSPLRLEHLLPEDKEALLRAMGARRRNARFSELIRLGKMVAHASDIDPEETLGAAVLQARMDWFATSDGQAEIKRDEAFVRVWRNAVAQSFGTLRPLIDPDRRHDDLSGNTEKPAKEGNEALIAESRQAALDLDIENFKRQLKMVFGAKANAAGVSRSFLFITADDEQHREIAWALMRLASVIRNRVSHFSIKGRLLDLIRGGALVPFDRASPLTNINRDGGKATSEALARFDELLRYDERLDWRVIIDGLTSLKAGSFLTMPQVQQVIGCLIEPVSDPDFVLPRFMATMRRAKGLESFDPQPLPGVRDIDLKNLAKSSDLDRLKLGLLLFAYDRGFQGWLAQNDDGGDALREIVRAIVAAKRGRTGAAAKEQKRAYVEVGTLLGENDLTQFATLKGLLGELQRLGMQANGDHLRYSADIDRQSVLSREIEEFRQEVVATLFGFYIEDVHLDWIWNLAEPAPDAAAIDLESLEQPAIANAAGGGAAAARHGHEAQFYAWLYLLPVETVSQLRHQFRKTIVLEKIAQKHSDPAAMAEDEDQLIRSMDRLMALYVRVQRAGFSGDEHKDSPALAELLYDDPEQFKRLFSDAAEHHDESIAGTRSGLREMLRFGHLPVLKPVFERHRVTSAEVAEQIGRDPDTQSWFDGKRTLHEKIVAACDVQNRDEDAITEMCASYEGLAVKCALHNFSVRAARLNDHIRAHHMMMAVIGRLVDFAGMWERDRFYLLLGMIYRQWADDGLEIELSANRKKEYGIAPANGGEERPFLPIWHATKGFALHREDQFWKKASYLRHDFREEFDRQFGNGEKHPYDEAAELARKVKAQRAPFDYQTGKKQIRNDLAHFNVLHPKHGRHINLTYLVNAVRSLFGHDRKMKNIVPRAIADVLAREGLKIEWKLKADRLKHPLVLPLVETHLSMVREQLGRPAPILVPRVSVRLNSMAKGLFDVDRGGYRKPIMVDGRESRRGEMGFPAETWNLYGQNMPAALRSFNLPESGSD